MFWGKIIGALFGWLVAGPMGLVFGVLVGHYFDRSFRFNYFNYDWVKQKNQKDKARITFFKATFSIMGHVAKADGRISEEEIKVAKRIMRHMLLSAEQKKLAVHYFNEGKRPGFNLQSMLKVLVEDCQHHSALLRVFIEIQMQAAFAEGVMTDNKKKVLEQICLALGIKPTFSEFQWSQERAHQYSHQQSSSNSSGRSGYQSYTAANEDYYAVLGVSKTATNAEVKRAYRKMMSQNHPDKLVAKGLPEEMMKLATEKTQRIQKAYEIIKKERKI